MTTAQLAIIISVISAAIAGLSLGWNIYRDVVLKAKVKITFGVRMIIQQGNPARPEYVNIAATNHGPGSVRLGMVQMKDSSWWRWLFRKEKYAVVIHDYMNPLSGQLPHKLEVGDKIDLLFHYDADCMFKNSCDDVFLTLEAKNRLTDMGVVTKAIQVGEPSSDDTHKFRQVWGDDGLPCRDLFRLVPIMEKLLEELLEDL